MRNVFIISVFTLSFVALFGVAYGQNATDQLSERRINMSIKDRSVGYAIYHLATRFNVPFGIEEKKHVELERIFLLPTNIPTDVRHANGSITVDIYDRPSKEVVLKRSPICTIVAVNEPLRDVLDRILAQVDGYRWEISDGVVNIIPTENRDSDISGLLETRIAMFGIQSGESVGNLRNHIVALPEFNSFFTGNPVLSLAIRSDFDYWNRRLETGFQLKGLELREILNRVTREKKGVWILRKVKNVKVPDKDFIEFEI